MASIAKRPDGRWRARYRDTAGREHAKHFDRKIDAQKWLDQVTAAVVTGQYVDPNAGRMTLAAYFETWSLRQIWTPNTRLAMDLAVRSVTFTDVPLNKLHRSHVEGWVKQMHETGLAPGTVRTRLNNVRAVLRAAVRDRVISADPSDGVVRPRARRAESLMTLPTPLQVQELLAAATGQWKPFVEVAAFAGLRLGEIAALQMGDVDFSRRALRVQRQVQRGMGGEVLISPPKYGSERTVAVPPALATTLRAHIEERDLAEGDAWLFGTDTPPHQNTVGYAWRQLCAKADLEGVTLHDLRHFYASGLIAAGCDVVTVQRALGHAKATTTLNTYSHLWPKAEDRTRAAAGTLIEQVTHARADCLRTTQIAPSSDLRKLA